MDYGLFLSLSGIGHRNLSNRDVKLIIIAIWNHDLLSVIVITIQDFVLKLQTGNSILNLALLSRSRISKSKIAITNHDHDTWFAISLYIFWNVILGDHLGELSGNAISEFNILLITNRLYLSMDQSQNAIWITISNLDLSNRQLPYF